MLYYSVLIFHVSNLMILLLLLLKNLKMCCILQNSSYWLINVCFSLLCFSFFLAHLEAPNTVCQKCIPTSHFYKWRTEMNEATLIILPVMIDFCCDMILWRSLWLFSPVNSCVVVYIADPPLMILKCDPSTDVPNIQWLIFMLWLPAGLQMPYRYPLGPAHSDTDIISIYTRPTWCKRHGSCTELKGNAVQRL